MFYLLLMVCMNGQCGMANIPAAFSTEKACQETGVASLPKKVTANTGGEPFTYNPRASLDAQGGRTMQTYIGQVSFFLCIEKKE